MRCGTVVTCFPHDSDSKGPPSQVAAHNSRGDCWVSLHGNVYDLSNFSFKNNRNILQPVLQLAGTDVSHWLDYDQTNTTESLQEKHRIKTYIDPINCLESTYAQDGEILRVISEEPRCNWQGTMPWWEDDSLIIGKLSSKACKISIKNATTGQEDVLEVPCEETIAQIKDRYWAYNGHGDSYLWICARLVADEVMFEELDLSLTLEQNGVMGSLDVDGNLNICSEKRMPVIYVQFADDLSVL